MSRLEKIKKNNLVYSRTEEQKEYRPWKKRIYLSLFILLLLGSVYFVFLSDAFAIKQFIVEGYENTSTIEELAKEQAGESLLSKNIILFNKNKLIEKVQGDPTVKRVAVKKIFPNKIKINIVISKPSIIWITAGEKWQIDDRGAVIGAPDTENYPTVYDGSNIKTGPGERVASPTFIKFINDIHKGFEAAAGSKISKITIFDLINDVHVQSLSGWTVYLDASKSAEGQLKNLTKILGEASKDSKRKLEYIDMRLENRIYYK